MPNIANIQLKSAQFGRRGFFDLHFMCDRFHSLLSGFRRACRRHRCILNALNVLIRSLAIANVYSLQNLRMCMLWIY